MSISAQSPTLPDRLIVAYLTALPLRWAIGLVLPFSVLMIGGTALFAVRSPRAWGLAWPWFLVGACQLMSSTFNLLATDQPIILVIRHALASYVLGWLMLGGCVAIGASGLLDRQRLLRAAARVGYYCVVLALVLYPLALAQGWQYLHVLTPIGLLLPVSLPSTSFNFGILLYNWEELFGVLLPRLSLLFPWTTAMGFGGLCLIYVRRQRAGALAPPADDLQQRVHGRGEHEPSGRAAAARHLAAAPLPRRPAGGAGAAGGARRRRRRRGGADIGTIGWGTPTALVDIVHERFDDLRPSATRSRDLVYLPPARGGL